MLTLCECVQMHYCGFDAEGQGYVFIFHLVSLAEVETEELL